MKRWIEVSPYSGIEEDAPANQAGSGNIAGLGVDHPDRPGSGEPGMPPRKKKKKDLFDARTKAYREHRAKLEAARERRAAKKESKFIKKITSEMRNEQKMECPPATQDVALNTKNRNATRDNHMYGPLNVKEPGDYWEKLAKRWKTTLEAAKKSKCGNCVAFDISPRMDECMPGSVSDESGRLGYCWMHHFKCHSARSCDTWATGGPIKEDTKSYQWQEKAFGKKEMAYGAGYDTAKPMAALNAQKSATGYDLYHKTFSSAMQHAYKFAKSKGFTVSTKDIDDKVASGPRKPSAGKTNSYILDTDKNKRVHIQVANLDNKRYELNMYIT
jgi:hypothetical protein